MQENSFLPDIGIPAKEFWKQVKQQAEEHDMDEVLAYMQLMIQKADHAGKEFNRQALHNHGRQVRLFPGVDKWFQLINGYAKGVNAEIEHYIISSGLKEMIKGSPLSGEFKYIFASGFSYDANDVPRFAARSVNFTTKTQYLFRINKGILNLLG